MHTHFSLFEGDRNAFHDPDDPYELSETGKAFVAGVLRHAKEITAVTNQWVNSYKRLIVGGEAPTNVCWGHANRSALVRVPMYSPGKSSTRRVEIRTPGQRLQPVPGLRGDPRRRAAGRRRRATSCRRPTEDDVWSLTETERRAMGYESLPQNLHEALVAMEHSELVAEILGEHVFDFFLRNKRAEWDAYRRHVTPVRAGDVPAGALTRRVEACSRRSSCCSAPPVTSPGGWCCRPSPRWPRTT